MRLDFFNPKKIFGLWWIATVSALVLFVACGEDKSSDSGSSGNPAETDGDDDQTDDTGTTDDGTTDETVEDTKLNVTFSKPAVKKDPTTDGAYTFELAFKNFPTDATWELYYTQTEGAIADGTPILAGQAPTVTSHTWKMGGLKEGEYFFYAVVVYPNGGSQPFPATGSIEYTESTGTVGVPPQIKGDSFDFADGDRLVSADSTATQIAYEVFDADGDTVTVKIELSSDGVTFDKEVAAAAGATGFTWDVSQMALTEGLYWMRIIADDGNGNTDEDQSSFPFAIVGAGNNYTYDTDVQPILAAACAPCHNNGGSNAATFRYDQYGVGPNSATGDVFAGYKSNRISYRSSDINTMPPLSHSVQLTDTQMAILKIWHLQGAPEN